MRTRLMLALSLTATIVAAGCSGNTGIKAHGGTAAPTDTTTVEPTTDAPTTPAEDDENVGYTFNITNNDAPAATVQAVSLRRTTSFNNSFETITPKSGNFLFFTMVLKATAQLDVNEFDYYVRGPDGTHYQVGEGNSAQAQPDTGTFSAQTLNAGETLRGVLTFDAPPHGTLVYAPGQNALVGWKF